jgi:hypothetical protein
MPVQDPDDLLVVLFKHLATENKAKSLAEGRPIFDDQEICEIRAPGSKDVNIASSKPRPRRPRPARRSTSRFSCPKVAAPS